MTEKKPSCDRKKKTGVTEKKNDWCDRKNTCCDRKRNPQIARDIPQKNATSGTLWTTKKLRAQLRAHKLHFDHKTSGTLRAHLGNPRNTSPTKFRAHLGRARVPRRGQTLTPRGLAEEQAAGRPDIVNLEAQATALEKGVTGHQQAEEAALLAEEGVPVAAAPMEAAAHRSLVHLILDRGHLARAHRALEMAVKRMVFSEF